MAKAARSQANELRAQRDKLGLNQADFWRPLHVTQSGGSRYESGRNIPGPVKLLLMLVYGPEAQSRKALADLRKAVRK
jgi:DNA-binding transcriptional regulator YiaG